MRQFKDYNPYFHSPVIRYFCRSRVSLAARDCPGISNRLLNSQFLPGCKSIFLRFFEGESESRNSSGLTHTNHHTTARSMACCNSRILPGQLYCLQLIVSHDFMPGLRYFCAYRKMGSQYRYIPSIRSEAAADF